MFGLYTEIVNTTRALIVVLHTDGRIVVFNPACERLTGYRLEEVQGRRVWDFLLAPEEADGVMAVFADLRAGHSPNTHENHWITKSGERRFIEWSNSAVTDKTGRVTYVIGTGTDVTRQKLVQRELFNSQARFRALSDNAIDITAIVGRDRTIQFITPSVHRLLGYTPAELLGHDRFDLVHPDDADAAVSSLRRALGSPGSTVRLEHRLRHKDGHWVHIAGSTISLLDDPAIDGVIYSGHDVTSRRITVDALRGAEQRKRALLDNMPDAAWMKDLQGRYIETNRMFIDRVSAPESGLGARVGIGRGHFEGRTDFDIFPADYARKLTGEDRRVIESKKPSVTERHIAAGANERWIEVTKAPLFDESGAVTGTVGIARDITERKLAEAQRMAHDAGLRAALVKEVHHRIKNNLQGVITLMETLATRHPENAKLLDAIITRIGAVATVHGLYGSTNERELRLDRILLGLVSSLKALYTDLPVHLSTRINSISVRVMESEIVPLALVVNELIMNAVKHSDSVAHRGPVDIALENAHDHASIVVRNHAGRLPEQFDFDAGAGLGNGLALVKSLLPSHGALLRFADAADGGVQAELTLRPPVIKFAASET
jgi:PAS domain S-box-containing protein